MDKIKETLAALQKRWEVAKREGEDKPKLGHFVFRGSPGTGKTTVARAIASVLHGLKLKPSPKIVETSGLDLTGDFIGQTSTKVTEKLREAKGGVLFIDEAYNLGEGSYGKEALDTILAAMTDPAYEDVCIIIAGYPNEINDMMKKNPGLKSRFTNYFEFEDWDEKDCTSFFEMCANEDLFELEGNLVKAVEEGCSTLLKLDGWANGRDVKRLFEETKVKRAMRVYDIPEDQKMLLEADFVDALKSMVDGRIPGSATSMVSLDDPLSPLEKLYKMETIRNKLDSMRKRWEVAKREGESKPKLGHFVFRGSPGTGKTTVARAIAAVLHGLKLKPSPKIVETSGLDLVAEYVGQTSTKVTEKLNEGKGGILFIDEAYNLGQGSFGKEALDTILAAMTDPEFEDVCIVIAGYPGDLDTMMRSNPGLKSRFTDFFDFEDWDEKDCASFFGICAKNDNAQLGPGVLDAIETGTKSILSLDGWANGRDVSQLYSKAKELRAERVYDVPEEVKTLVLEDVRGAIDTMISARAPVVDAATSSNKPLDEAWPPQKEERNDDNKEDNGTVPVFDTDSEDGDKHKNSNPPKYISPHHQRRVRECHDLVQATQTANPLLPPKNPEPSYGSSAGPPPNKEEAEEEEEDMEQAQETAEASEAKEEQGALEEIETMEETGHDETTSDGVPRDDGVPDDIWAELEASKAAEQEHEQELIREREEAARRLEELEKAKEEAERRHAQEMERIQKLEEEQAQRKAEEEARRLEELERQRVEEERRRLEEEERQRRLAEQRKEEVRRRLRQIANCPMGFTWHKTGGGWRCAGGSHFVSNAELQRQFGFDVDEL